VFERVTLKRALGMENKVELPLAGVIGEALKSREVWFALLLDPCQKEEAERELERHPSIDHDVDPP